MNYLIIVLRLVHVVAGVLWVGAALMMTLYIGPAVGATGEVGEKFMAYFVSKTNVQKMLMATAGATVLAGIFLMAVKPEAWFQSSAGKGFGIGAIFAIIGFVYGILLGRTVKVMGQLGAQIKGQPTPEQAAQMQTLQNRQRSYSTVNSVALIIAVAFMAIARYFTF